MKVLSLVAFALFGLLIAGCDRARDVMPEEGNWDKEASAYFNANLPGLKNLPGKVYDYQNIRIQSNGATRQVVWIDGVKTLEFHANSNVKVPGTARIVTAYQGVRIHWSQAEGYKVDTGRVGLDETVKMLKGNHKEYWHAFL